MSPTTVVSTQMVINKGTQISKPAKRYFFIRFSHPQQGTLATHRVPHLLCLRLNMRTMMAACWPHLESLSYTIRCP
jgi:hypothetical protein